MGQEDPLASSPASYSLMTFLSVTHTLNPKSCLDQKHFQVQPKSLFHVRGKWWDNLHYHGYGWMKCTPIFFEVSSDKVGTLLGPWKIFECWPGRQLSECRRRKESCDMQFFGQRRWFKEQVLISGLCQKFAVRLCCGPGKRVRHWAQEKCLW